MKHHILSVGLLAAMAVSCAVNEIDYSKSDGLSSEIFYAQFESPNEDPSTRVYATEDLYIRWNADDRITIFNKYTYNQEYCFNGETGDNSGSFRRVDNGDFVTGNSLDNIYAIYPYLESTRISDTGVMTVTLPAEQKYAENTFGLGANTMISATTDNQLMFKNVGGYLMLKLYGEDVTVSSISLKGNNGEKLTGKATITMPVDGVPSIEMANDAGKEITLVCDTPVRIGSSVETATSFWVVLPPTVFREGFTLTVKDDKNGVFEKSTTKIFEVSRNRLARMSALEVIPAQPTPSDDAIVFADEKVKSKLVAAFDTNRDGELSYKEAASVTSGDDLKNAFGSIKTYKSFNEFQYFTSIQTVPVAMFMEWNLLSSIVVPEGVSTIEAYAFRSCSKLSAINIPDSVEIIGNAAFLGCTNLTSIIIPEGVKSIKNSTFSGCSNLSYVSVPSSITSIEENAFFDCESLCSITIPEGVTSLSKRLFSGCSSLSTIVIPNSVSEIWDYAFYNCSSLISVTIPHGMWVLRKFVFAGCSNLSNVYLPESVTYLDNGVFYNCSKLKSIDLSRIQYIGSSAFFGCSSLSSIVISESVSQIWEETFKGCTNLSSVVIPESVTAIRNSAFYGCNSLTTVCIPESVSIIGEKAFYNCNALTRLFMTNSTPPTGASFMLTNTNNCPIYVPAESLEAYKTAQYWSEYADRIQAIPSVPVPEAVDLGLPSGIKWASFNLGASKPEEYGDYYAWGEIEPYYSDLEYYYSSDHPFWKEGKNGYNWSSYKWCMGSEDTLTKYCSNSTFGYNGFTDNKTVLDYEDDAAYMALGGKWRMPIDKEWAELHENCNWIYTLINGKPGYTITSKIAGFSDKSIFLPFSGDFSDDGLWNTDSNGYYWSSSLNQDNTNEAKIMELFYQEWNTTTTNRIKEKTMPRRFGFSIRPVYAE